MGKDKRKDKRREKRREKRGDGVSPDKASKVAKLPKKKCCVSKSRCNRCPLRMLKEGTLPEGYTVKRRKLVRVDRTGAKKSKKIAA